MARTRFVIAALIVSALAMILALACDDLVTETIETTIAGHPIADFRLAGGSDAPDSGCVPFTVSFEDFSAGPINKWVWYFGDGDSAVNDTNPTHTYDSAGLYDVTLRVEDTATEGVDTEVKRRFILAGTVVADFATSDTLICSELPVTFTPTSVGGASSLKWYFGDGDSLAVGAAAIDSPAVHTYMAPGLYGVTLSATGDCGTKAFTKTDFVRVVECPEAIITLSADRECVPFMEHFADTASIVPDGEVISARSWDFGDGLHTSIKSVDSIQYASADTFVVRLAIATTNGGYDTAWDTVYGIPSTTADFTTLSPAKGCLIPGRQFQVKFQSQALGEIDSLLWEFGDGDTAWNDPAPVHAYDEGAYTVQLTAYGTCGTEVGSQVDLVRVSGNLVPPASFGIWNDALSMLVGNDTIIADSGQTVSFFDNTTPSLVKQRLWFFADMTTPGTDSLFQREFNDSAGQYTVAFVIYNDCDSLSTGVHTITVLRSTP